MSKVLVPLAEGFEDIEAVTIIDVLRRGGVEVVSAALGSSRDVLAAHGILMRADSLLDDVLDDEFDAIILPGGGQGTDNLKACEPLHARLRRQQEEERLVCAICAAPTVLVQAGALKEGQHVTCYPTCSVDLDRPCANVPVVGDGNVITGQAPGSALLFSLVVLQALEGDTIANRVARGMVTDVI